MHAFLYYRNNYSDTSNRITTSQSFLSARKDPISAGKTREVALDS